MSARRTRPVRTKILAALRGSRPQTTQELVITVYGEWSEKHYNATTQAVRLLEREGYVQIDRSTRPAIVAPITSAAAQPEPT